MVGVGCGGGREGGGGGTRAESPTEVVGPDTIAANRPQRQCDLMIDSSQGERGLEVGLPLHLHHQPLPLTRCCEAAQAGPGAGTAVLGDRAAHQSRPA